jgi:RNA polymerase-binding protein DksA
MAQRTSSGANSRSRGGSSRSGARGTAKKSVAKKAPAKKAPAKKSVAKKTPAKKTAPKKAPAKKPMAKKAPAKKAPAKKSVAKKAPAKKTVAKKTPAKKSVAKQASTKQASTKQAPKKQTAAAQDVPPPPQEQIKKAPQRPKGPLKTAATSAPRPPGRRRKPLTPDERAEMKNVLLAERTRLEREIAMAVEDLNELLRDSGDGSGDDQADAGSKTFEREHEMSVANNSRDLLVQVEHALGRIADGTYGTCESCGYPIGKMRLEAFPRATLCVDCKQRQERR